MRVYAWLYGLALSLLAIALAGIALASGRHNLKVPIFSFEGPAVTGWLLALGIAGLLGVVLSVTNWFRWLLPLWFLIAFVLLFRGYFASPYTFAGRAGFMSAALLSAGALIAFVCSLARPRRNENKKF